MLIRVSTSQEFRTERESANATGDCAVRAFATFFDVDYDTARAQLNRFNKSRDCVNGTNSHSLTIALEVYGESRGIKVTQHFDKRGVKVRTLANQVEKAMIISRDHATVAMNGVLYGNLSADIRRGDDANQKVSHYYTMEVVDINKYLSGNV